MAIYRGDTKVSGVGKGFRPENTGTEGQVLTKTATGYAYQDVEALPDGGTVGQVLTKTQSGADWEDAQGGLPEGGTEGQFIRKTATGSEWVAGELVEIKTDDDYSAMRGPAPEGFHVPLSTEWEGVKTIMIGLGFTVGNSWRINLHLPFAGGRGQSSSDVSSQGSVGSYWSSSPMYTKRALRLQLLSSFVNASDVMDRAWGLSVRCFKNSYVEPTSSWTVIQGTLGSAGIFWDQSEGLISITDGTTGYTIMDKNLGATTVYSDGDSLSEANCGKYYQRGNNYGFNWDGSVTTSSMQVDASVYGPGNYYSSSTYITGNQDWSSVQNDNLRGGVTGIILRGKYAGDSKINELPEGGTEGQILMMVNGTPTWVTPTAKGFKMIASDSPLTVPYDWYGTEAQYTAATKDSGTEYRTV